MTRTTFCAALLAGMFLAVYLFLAPPGIVFGDSPELALSAASLGIPHAPGYPLFNLLYRAAIAALPGLEPAAACNALSAVLGALSVALLFLTCILTGASLPAAATAAAILGSAPLVVGQSTVCEVYALNLLIFCLIAWLAARYARSGDGRFLISASFAIGIGLANHHTLLSFAAVIAIVAMLHRRGRAVMLPSLLLLAFGLTTYLYLPLRGSAHPAISLGDVTTAQGVLDIILRRQFGFGTGSLTSDKVLLHLGHYATLLYRQFPPLALATAALGLVVLFRNDRRAAVIVSALFVINGIGTYLLLRSDAEELFLVDAFVAPSLAATAICVAHGLSWAATRNRIAGIVATAAIVVTMAFRLQADLPGLDQRDNRFAAHIAREILATAPPSAIIIGESDYALFPLWYVQNVTGFRRDVIALDADFLMLPWYQRQHLARFPVLKEIIPEIGSHAAGGTAGHIDFAALEEFKLNQSVQLADNAYARLGRQSLLTYDFAEMARTYRPDIAKRLVARGPAFLLQQPGTQPMPPWTPDLTPFHRSVPLPDEEVVFLKPYKSALEQEFVRLFTDGSFDRAAGVIENLQRIDPSPANAINIALTLAEQGRSLDRASALLDDAVAKAATYDYRVPMARGLIAMKQGRMADARALLQDVVTQKPDSCLSLLYLSMFARKTGDAALADRCRAKIDAVCPDPIRRRAQALTN